MPIYERHGLQSVGWWVADKKDSFGNDQFVCLLAGESVAAIQKSVGEFHKDSEWQKIEKETEQDRKLRGGRRSYQNAGGRFFEAKMREP